MKIDLKHPKPNENTFGISEELKERLDGCDLSNSGFFDTYRHLNPDKD